MAESAVAVGGERFTTPAKVAEAQRAREEFMAKRGKKRSKKRGKMRYA